MNNDHSPTVQRAMAADRNNTNDGGHADRSITALADIAVPAVSLPTIIKAHAVPHHQVWKPEPLVRAEQPARTQAPLGVVARRTAWWWEPFLVVAAAIFVAECGTKILTGHWVGG